VAAHDQPLWYFGYGSNLCRATFLERRGMRPLATRIGRLDGHRLCFDLPIGPGERGVANVVADPASHVWGALYLLTPEQFAQLDRTEGVPVGVYERAAVPVSAHGGLASWPPGEAPFGEMAPAGGERVDAFTYRSARGTRGRKPSPRYMGLILAGAREHELPSAWIAYLERFELAVDERVAVVAPPAAAP
jgi:hypothetical protein